MRRPNPPDGALARSLRAALDAPGTPPAEHATEAQIAAYLARELRDDEIERLEHHLARCATCMDDLLAAAAVEDELTAQATRVAAPADEPFAGALASERPARTSRMQDDAVREAVRRASLPRSRRRSWVRIAASVAIVFGTLAVAAAAGSRILLGKLEPVLLGGMSNVLARKVTGGGASIVLAGGPGIELNDVSIAEDPAFGGGSFARVQGAALQLDPAALLRGQVRGAVHLDQPVVHLSRDAAGRWNVESLSGRRGVPTGVPSDVLQKAAAERAAQAGKARLVRLTSASVADGVLRISDRSGKGSDVTLRNVDLSYRSADPTAPAAVTLAGTVGDGSQRIALSGEIGPFEGSETPSYRFAQVELQSLPLGDIPGAPPDVSGKLSFDGTLASSGSGLDTVLANASGDGALGICCGELRQRNLTAELLAALTQHAGGDAAATTSDVLTRAQQSPALAATLALDATPFEDISGSVRIASGDLSFEELAVETALFKASAAGSLTRAGAVDARGTLTLTPAATTAIAQLVPQAARLFGAGSTLEVPFTVAGTWPGVQVKVDVRTALARLARPLDPRRLAVLPLLAG
jgi:hypothetical protein